MAYIMEKYGLAYFPLPKAACTSLKTYFYAVAQGEAFAPHREADGRMVHIHNKIFSRPFVEHGLNGRLATCHRVAVIRDPVERFVSAFVNRVLFHKELTAAALNTPVARAMELAPDPPFELFVKRLEEYRLASWSIRHHTDPASYFLGPDLEYFHRIYKFEEIDQLQIEINALTNTQFAVPHEQKTRVPFDRPSPKHPCWKRLREFCAGDYALMQRYYRL